MAIGDTDLMRDELINRGLGTSPVASRSIQQKDISELRNLRGEVLESTTRAARLEKERAMKAIQANLKKNQGGGRGGAAGGGGLQAADSAVLRVLDQPTGTAPGQRDAQGRSFVLTYADDNGVKRNQAFGSLGEAQAFAKARGININLTGSPVLQRGDALTRELERGNIGRVAVGDALRQVGSFRQLSVAPIVRGMAAIRQRKTISDETTSTRSAPTAAQTARGKIESGINAFNIAKRSGNQDAINAQAELSRRLSSGTGSAFLAELRAAGVITD